ncbi:cupredoxin domain-containing protein [Conexibacter sp. JD483]|uniref:cupredoxin domain-containing protein n=1 Tax=unclassified Conexibacter TaxID=2627773 RepID=UPI002726DD23|nr:MULTISPECIES: cupredoxin domain-containing protein [unclassified Conexibacter]MDO8188349.1 cupredoxin domain-containing protein [Conexibacter sp. CPCC 205706]MDO8201095.1 cupredoxin domain-containing protein [Conexibacter sp. CPCC 205762]MDR9372149.1 cupredoxin domain-containing protein [Conexibacter sp. JD483]
MHAGSSRLLGAVVAAVPAALAVVVVTVPSAPAAKRPAASTAVGVSQREFRLTPYRTRVPVGEVRFNVTNFGEDVHDLVVRDARGRVLARSAEVRSGGRLTLAVKLKRGRYRLSCDVANHAQLGMRAGFTVVKPRGGR